jgi:hypothetical protein
MPFGERNRPPGVPALDDHPERRLIVDFASRGSSPVLPARDVADGVVQAIRDRRFTVLPHLDDAPSWVEARLRWMLENIPRRPARDGLDPRR